MDPRKHFSALNIIHKIIRERVQPGDLCIDATAGRGNDALFLAELVGETGHVTAFDIQQDAVDSTKKLLEEHGMTSRTDVLLKSHSETRYSRKALYPALRSISGGFPRATTTYLRTNPPAFRRSKRG